jgi:hypothetical protein
MKKNFFIVANCSDTECEFLANMFKFAAVANKEGRDTIVGFTYHLMPASIEEEHGYIRLVPTSEVEGMEHCNNLYIYVRDAELPKLIRYFRTTVMGKKTRDSEEQIIAFTNSLTPDFCHLLDDYEQAWTVNNQTGLRQILKMKIAEA